MKILLDTNVLLAAFIAGGRCAEVIDHAVHDHELYYTDFILGELRDKLETKFKAADTAVADATGFLRRFFTRGVTSKTIQPVCRDPDDDQVLADAVANHIDAIITGDQDLLILKGHKGVRILSPKDYWTL